MRTLLAAVILGAAVAGSVAFTEDRDAQSERAFRQDMRRLWMEYDATWRHHSISSVGNLPDAGAVSKRFLRNADDLGKAFDAYLGDKRGAKLGTLLRGLATEENARVIARYLASVNPHWNKDDVEKKLLKRLDLKNVEIECRQTSDWAGDIMAADRG